MFLKYYLNGNGDRIYTLKKNNPSGEPTTSAHPARFSPDDKFSRHRVTIKKRFGQLLTQSPKPVLTLIQCPRLLLRSVPVVKLTQKSGPLLSITAYVRNVNTNKLNFSKKKAYYVTLAERQCWKCGRKNGHDKQETFFCKCGIIQEVPDDISYFDIMEIDESFDIESNKLSDKLKALQRKLHPDKFAQRSDEEMRISADQSSIVNKAYQTLSKPLNRGLYLLKLHGHIIEEDNTDMDPIFLLEIMECNEAIADVETPDAVQQLKIENTIIFEKLLKEASTKFLSNDFRSAKEILAQAKYYDNILEKLKIKMGDLGIVS